MTLRASLTGRVVRPRAQCIAKKNAKSLVFSKFNRLVFKSPSDYATLLNVFVDRLRRSHDGEKYFAV
jgi:hypothetical protein